MPIATAAAAVAHAQLSLETRRPLGPRLLYGILDAREAIVKGGRRRGMWEKQRHEESWRSGKVDACSVVAQSLSAPRPPPASHCLSPLHAFAVYLVAPQARTERNERLDKGGRKKS